MVSKAHFWARERTAAKVPVHKALLYSSVCALPRIFAELP